MGLKTRYETLVSKIRTNTSTLRFDSVNQSRWYSPQIDECKSYLINTTIYTLTYNFLRQNQVSAKPLNTPRPETLIIYNKLYALIGSELYRSMAHKVTQDQILSFAGATGDHQWIHTDSNKALKESPFRSTIAHGFLLVSLLPVMRNVNEIEYFRSAKLIVLRGLENLTFDAPVKQGQKIKASFILNSVSLGKRYVDISEDVNVMLAHSGKVVFRATIASRIYI